MIMVDLSAVPLGDAVMPILPGLAAVVLVLHLRARRRTAALRELARRIAERPADATGPIGFADIPREVEPVVAAVNSLLHRMRQRRDRAEAAHRSRGRRTDPAQSLSSAELVDIARPVVVQQTR